MKTKFVYVAMDGTEFKNYEECRDYENKYLEEHAKILLDKNFEVITTNSQEISYLLVDNKPYFYNSKKAHYVNLTDKVNRMCEEINNKLDYFEEIKKEMNNLYKEKEKLDKAIDAFINYMN